MLRIGIVGAGKNTRTFHIPKLQELGDVEIPEHLTVKLTSFATGVKYMAFTEAVGQSMREGKLTQVQMV